MSDTPSQMKHEKTRDAHHLHFNVDGMHCASCVRRLEKAVGKVDGVTDVTANLASGRVSLEYAGTADSQALIERVARAGFSAAQTSIDLAIDGMSCASCVSRVEKGIARVPGVVDVAVNLANERAHVSLLAGSADTEALIAAVRKRGYNAHSLNDDEPDQPQRRKQQDARRLTHLWLAVGLTLPLVIISMGQHLFQGFGDWLNDLLTPVGNAWLQAILASLVLAWPGRGFFSTGLMALFRKSPEMNSLVAVGAGAAWLYSMVVLLAPGLIPNASQHLYFEPAAVIVTLILAGRVLEARAKGRSSEAVKKLLDLRVESARRITAQGEEKVPVGQVQPGDLLRARPGERIAVDGTVVEGHSWVDESMLSGEPAPVAKEPGAEVSAATLNGSGTFTYHAVHVGRDTRLARIARMVEQAQASKLPIQSLIDRVSAVFVPTIMGLALVTFLVWLVCGAQLGMSLSVAVSVLIIACPCAMGLATPVSIMVASGRAAQLGILVRNGEALQHLRATRVVAFDKTGTLTEGKPRLIDTLTIAGIDGEQMLQWVAAVEAGSEHPLAQAIVHAASAAVGNGQERASAHDVRIVAGKGVMGEVSGHRVAVGNLAWLSDELLTDPAAALDPGIKAQGDKAAAQGATPCHVAIDGRLAGVLLVADAPRAKAQQAVESLKKMGIRVVMLSGDNQATAEAVGHTVGVDEVKAPLLPGEKEQVLETLRTQYGAVAFVGDGLNDAPALARADTGIAMGSGTDIAIEAGDVVLMSSRIENVPTALALGRATLRNIYQNLGWAFGYNLCLVPVAAGVLYPAFHLLLTPAIAAFAMALSSLFVLSNALRLRRFSSQAKG